MKSSHVVLSVGFKLVNAGQCSLGLFCTLSRRPVTSHHRGSDVSMHVPARAAEVVRTGHRRSSLQATAPSSPPVHLSSFKHSDLAPTSHDATPLPCTSADISFEFKSAKGQAGPVVLDLQATLSSLESIPSSVSHLLTTSPQSAVPPSAFVPHSSDASTRPCNLAGFSSVIHDACVQPVHVIADSDTKSPTAAIATPSTLTSSSLSRSLHTDSLPSLVSSLNIVDYSDVDESSDVEEVPDYDCVG